MDNSTIRVHPPRFGKSIDLVKFAAANNTPIYCQSERTAKQMTNIANHLGLTIPNPIVL